MKLKIYVVHVKGHELVGGCEHPQLSIMGKTRKMAATAKYDPTRDLLVLDWLHVQQTEDEFGFIAGAISVVSSTHSRRNAQFTLCVNL